MSQRNHNVVSDVLDALRDGLGPYVLERYRQQYDHDKYLRILGESVSGANSRHQLSLGSDDEAERKIDVAGWLYSIWNNREPFKKYLGRDFKGSDADARNGFSFVDELRNARNKWAHSKRRERFTDQDVYRLADTATRLLQAVGAEKHGANTEEIKLEYGQKIYGSEDAVTEPAAKEADVTPATTADAEPLTQPAHAENSDEVGNRVDLRGLDLSGLDLRGRNLHLANLKGIDLSGSILQFAHLADMDLSNAKLSKADLSEANLGGCNLNHADLSEARLDFADLTNASFSHAKMEKVNLGQAKINGADLSYADLTGVDMSNPRKVVEEDTLYDVDDHELFDRLWQEIRCSDVDLSYAILRCANMQRTFLEPANLTGADMTGADFTGARIAACELNGAILNSANLSKCHILSCDFSGAKMQGINLSRTECVYSRFTNSEMSGANLKNFVIGDRDDDIDDSWDNVDLSEADLCGAILPGLSFRNANLTGAIFKDADLSGADLSHTDLMDTDFTDAELKCAKFDGAKFRYGTILPDGSYWDDDTDMTRFTG